MEIVKELALMRNDFILDLVGDGESKPALEEYVTQHKLEHFVHFHGFKQKQDLPVYFAQSTAFLFQTDFDVWGLTLNEAMAAGVPCLSSINAGASFDLVEENETGFMVDFNKREEVIKIINRLLQLL